MKNCPNCGQLVDAGQSICPNCGQTLTEVKTRAAYRAEFKPEKSNSTVLKMLSWIRKNATLVFLLAFFLLIVMNLSPMLGWISFWALMILLYAQCKRVDKIERYTADERLTEFLNQIFSNTFNRVDKRRSKIKEKREHFTQSHPQVKKQVEELKQACHKRVSIWQLLVILTAGINLVLLFYSATDAQVDTKTMIAQVIFSFGEQLFSASKTFPYGLIVFLILLALIFIPVIIIFQAFKNTKKSRIIASAVSIFQSIVLLYAAFHLTQSTVNISQFGQITRQLLTNVVAIGTSAYLLILDSLITSSLSLMNIFKQNKKF